MTSLLTARLLPRPGKIEQQQILIVLLAQAFQSDDVTELMKAKINSTIQEELPGIESNIITITNVERGEYDVDGTLTDVYTVAREAQNLGWLSMIILDALSTRQLLGTTRWGENPALTAITVYLKCQEDDWRPNKSAVFIKRLSLDSAYHSVMAPMQKKWSDMVYRPEEDLHPALPERMFRGMYLSDPHKSSFMDDSVHDQYQRTIEKALNNSEPNLPNEIKLFIKKEVREEPPISDLTDAPAENSVVGGCLRIQSFFRLEPHQLRLATHHIKEAARNTGWTGDVSIHQWKQHVPCSRRNFIKLYQRHLQANYEREPYSFLVKCSETSDQIEITLGWAVEDEYRQLLLVTGSANDLVQRRISGTGPFMFRGNELCKRDNLLPESASVERIFSPTNTFPPSTPLWQEPNHGGGTYGRVNAPPVFYLSKNLSKDEHQAIFHALQERDEADDTYNIEDGEKKYSFVEWTNKEDGTVEDMFRILWYMRHHRGGRDSYHECIFVDKQTAKDNTAILAAARYTGNLTYSGMEYGRTAAKCTNIAWINLSIGNMAIEDFVDGEPGEWNELLFFKDPDYDGPLTYDEREQLEQRQARTAARQLATESAEGSTGEESDESSIGEDL